jgi:hypothetical protein
MSFRLFRRTVSRGASHRSTDRARREPYATGGAEPPLNELMNEPVLRLVMRRSGTTPDQLRALIRRIHQRSF